MTSFLIAIAMCYVLFKIPFWILSCIRGGGRSYLGSMVKAFVAYKTLGVLGSVPGRLSWARNTAASDPYARVKATSSGQYMLPLNVKRQPKPKPRKQQQPAHDPAASTATRRSSPQGQQLKLPLDGEWPENKPRVGRHRQYELPFHLQRQPRKKPEDTGEQSAPESPKPPPVRSQQTRMPRTGDWPEDRPVLNRTGQYRLPIRAERVPKPVPPPAPPRRRPGPDRQEPLPLNLPQPTTPPGGNNTRRGGAKPQPNTASPVPPRPRRSGSQPSSPHAEPKSLPKVPARHPKPRRKGGEQ